VRFAQWSLLSIVTFLKMLIHDFTFFEGMLKISFRMDRDLRSKCRSFASVCTLAIATRDMFRISFSEESPCTQIVDSVPRCPWHGSETTTRKEIAYLSCASRTPFAPVCTADLQGVSEVRLRSFSTVHFEWHFVIFFSDVSQTHRNILLSSYWQ